MDLRTMTADELLDLQRRLQLSGMASDILLTSGRLIGGTLVCTTIPTPRTQLGELKETLKIHASHGFSVAVEPGYFIVGPWESIEIIRTMMP